MFQRQMTYFVIKNKQHTKKGTQHTRKGAKSNEKTNKQNGKGSKERFLHSNKKKKRRKQTYRVTEVRVESIRELGYA